MKSRQFAVCIILLSMIIIAGCKKDKDEKVKELSVTEAKTELRNGSQTITSEMDKMMNMPAMISLDYFSQLMENGGWKSSIKNLAFNSGKLHLAKVKSAFRHDNDKRGIAEVGDFGVYHYNFTTHNFDLVETSTTQLVFLYPADEQATSSKKNNAKLLLDKLAYANITYTETYFDEYTQKWVTETYEEKVPSKAEVSLKIDNAIVMNMNYNATYNGSGFPTAMTASLTMGSYEFQTSLSGSGVNYQTTFSFKQSGTVLMAYDWAIIYSSDMSEVVKATGNHTITPLKVKGWVNIAAIEKHMNEIEEEEGSYDLGFLNKQLDMELIQVELNAKIGDIEFKMYTDQEDGESYPMLAVVYSDGTHEWLENIMGDGSYKFRKTR